MKKILVIFILLNSGFGFAQRDKHLFPDKQHMELKDITRIISIQLRNIVSSDWVIEAGDSSVVFTYCRQCKVPFEAYCDSLYKAPFSWDAESDAEIHQRIFKQLGPDSISYAGAVSMYGSDPIDWYKPNNILTIEIRFSELWSKDKIRYVQSRNDALKNAILKEPLYKTIISFDDYRAFLPDKYLRERTKQFDYYFERLPYESRKYNYSIFLSSNKESMETTTVFFDRNDPEYYSKKENFIENERKQLLILIAYFLELKDFKYIN